MCSMDHIAQFWVLNPHQWPFQTYMFRFRRSKKVQVGKDQEKAQSEKDSHSKNRGGKKNHLIQHQPCCTVTDFVTQDRNNLDK